MFGLNLEANLYLESVSKFLSGCFPVLKRESLLITFFIKLRKEKKKKAVFFQESNLFSTKKTKTKCNQNPTGQIVLHIVYSYKQLAHLLIQNRVI